MDESFLQLIQIQVDGDYVSATRPGGLYGMDMEVGSENLDVEQDEPGDIGGVDADIPAEMRSVVAHDARVKGSPHSLQRTKSRVTMPHTAPIGAGVPSAAPPAQGRTRTRERARTTRRWACLWSTSITTSWKRSSQS